MDNSIKPSNSYISITLVLLVYLSILNNLSIVNFNFIGLSSIGSIFIICSIVLTAYLIKSKLSKFHLWLLTIGGAYALLNLFGLFQFENDRVAYVSFQFTLLYIFFLTISLINWRPEKLRLLSTIAGLLVISNFVVLFVKGFPIHFSGLFDNPNSLGVYIFLSFFFFAIGFERKKSLMFVSILLLSIVLIYFSSTRSIFISLASVAITYLAWKIISKNKFRFISYFLSIVIGLAAFVFIYPKMTNWQNFQSLNNLTWEYTGKNLMSGREIIWSKIIDAINQKLWFGYGAGNTASTIEGVQLSAHNLYIQTAYQLGLIGLLTLVLILATAWLGMWKGRYDQRVRLSASFFIGILVQQSFEVTLTQNNMAIALMQWLIIGIGVGISFRYKE